MVDPEAFIRDQFPFELWPIVPTVMRQAYGAADGVIADNPILQTQSAADNRGRIVSWAVDFGFERAIKSGALQCDYRWMPYALPTGRYLELRFSHSRASISQVSDPYRQPRNVVFRENARLTTQPTFDLKEFRDDQTVKGVPHFLVVHGHQQLNFTHLGVPSATSKVKWSWLSQNLMTLPHAMPSDDRPPPEDTDTDFSSINLLKEELEKWMRDNGEQ